jgi:hypothetical protein
MTYSGAGRACAGVRASGAGTGHKAGVMPGGKKLIDCMGKSELAAHLFRITLYSSHRSLSGVHC